MPHFTLRGRWPDPSRLTYRVEDRPGPVAAEAFAAAIAEACAAWTSTGLVGLVPAADGAEADVTLGWRRGHHGACEPFSADSAVAHSGPVRSGTFVHFDAGREWSTDGAQGNTVYGTALHELGHVLGLGHSHAADAVMRTGVVRAVPLSDSERFGLQTLYGGGDDAPGDVRVQSTSGEPRRTMLRGVAPSGRSEFAVFDTDGDAKDELLVWRTDREGLGQLMIYHFGSGLQVQRTTGPFLGVISPSAEYAVLRTAKGHRVLVSQFSNGKRSARHFDEHGVLRPFSMHLVGDEELGAARANGLPRTGDLDGDGERERVDAVR